MRVLTEHSTDQTATVGVFIDAGSRYEWETEHGVAHFVEHMLFKGTKNRTRHDIEYEIESMGGILNAYTTRETTVFYAKVNNKDVPKAILILGDILTNSLFSESFIESERDIILREMESVEANMQEVIMDELHGMAYKDQPLGRTILGTPYSISQLSKSQMEQYIRCHYTGPRIIVACCGNVDHDVVAKSVEKSFSGIPRESTSLIPPRKGTAYFLGSLVSIREDTMPLCHVAYAYETAGWNDPDVFPLLCYQMMLGSYVKGNSTAMYSGNEYIADIAKNDLAESVTPFNTLYSDTGLFGLYMVHDPMTLYEGNRIACENFLRHTYDCSPEKLEEAKNKLKVALLSQLDGSTPTCEEIGRQVITSGRRMHPLETLQRIEEVDVIAINNLGKRFFYDLDPVVAAKGPIHEFQSWEWWRRRSYTHRQ